MYSTTVEVVTRRKNARSEPRSQIATESNAKGGVRLILIDVFLT